MLLPCLTLSVKLWRACRIIGKIHQQSFSANNLPDYTILLPSIILLLKDDSESQYSEKHFIRAWCYCGHCILLMLYSLLAPTVFSHKSFPKYLHKILLPLPDTFLIIAIFSKGWCCLPHLQDTVESKRCLKMLGSPRYILLTYLLLSSIYKLQFLCGTTCSYLGQRPAISPSHKMHLWNLNNNNNNAL